MNILDIFDSIKTTLTKIPEIKQVFFEGDEAQSVESVGNFVVLCDDGEERVFCGNYIKRRFFASIKFVVYNPALANKNKMETIISLSEKIEIELNNSILVKIIDNFYCTGIEPCAVFDGENEYGEGRILKFIFEKGE